MAEAAGLAEINSLYEAGFSDDEVSQWQADTKYQLKEAGFNSQEVSDYFGVKNPSMDYLKDTFIANFEKNRPQKPEGQAIEGQPEGTMEIPQDQMQVETAQTFGEAFESGWDTSVSGLIVQGKAPDVVLDENPEMAMRIVSHIAALAGDLPAMAIGSVAGGAIGGYVGTAAGGAIGSVIPGAGTAAGGAVGGTIGMTVGGGYGSMALPAAMREALMQHYEKGDVDSFSDFFERTSAVFWAQLQAGTIGAATMGAGKLVGGTMAKTAAPAIAKTSAEVATEIATMVSVGAALEGEVPEPHEFIDAAILVGGMRLVTSKPLIRKMQRTYAKTGMKPNEVVEKANVDPKFKQELLSENVELPQGTVTIGGEFGGYVPKPKKFEIPEIKTSSAEKLPGGPGGGEPPNPIRAKIGKAAKKAGVPLSFREFYKDRIDKLDPIREAIKILKENPETLRAHRNPYMLARMAVDAKAKAKHFFEKGTVKYDTLAASGEGLVSILSRVKSVEKLEDFMVSKRVLEKEAQGIKTGFDVEAAKQIVKTHKAEYGKAAAEVSEFSNRVLGYITDAGILSPEQAIRIMEANKDYVPWKRLRELDAEAATGVKPGSKKGSLKEMKGSGWDIQSPIQSIVENTIELIQMAESNRAPKALVELAARTEGQTLIQKVKQPVRPVKISEKDVGKALEEMGVNPELAEPITTFISQKRDLTKTQFEVYRKGKREVYETTPFLAESLNTLGGDSGSMNMAFKVARGITTFKKVGITFTPDFVVRNFMRDTITGKVLSEGGLKPMDILGGLGSMIKKDKHYYNWLKSGGANGAFLELTDKYISKEIYKVQAETKFMNAVRNVAVKPLEMMRVGAELSEQSVRLGEFKKVSKGKTSPQALMSGGFAAREVTLDFQRMGAKMSAWNSITAFQNVAIQGIDKTARAMGKNPKQVLARSAAYITAPSVLLWWANKDDQRVQELPQWQKDFFWIIATDKWVDAEPGEADQMQPHLLRNNNGKMQINKGVIYRVPKPHELGMVFGSLPERGLDAYFKDNPDAMKDFNSTMVKTFTPTVLPDAVTPVIEQFFNKSIFTGRDIIPHHLTGVFPDYQFVEYSSETAKVLGKMVATIDRESQIASPMILDNYIRSWSGALGQYALGVSDKLLVASGVAPERIRPADTLADMPIIKSFVVRYPLAGSKSVQTFYDNYEKTSKTTNTLKMLAKAGDEEGHKKELALQENKENMVHLDGIKKSLANQAAYVRNIYKSPDMTPDEKRQMIDGVYLYMTETAKAGNQILKEFKKSVKEEK